MSQGIGARDRAGLLDLRVGRRAAQALRDVAAEARGLAPGRVALVVLYGSRARGLARAGSDYDLAVILDRDPPSPGFSDDLADLCIPHALDGVRIHSVALVMPGVGEEPGPLLADALRDGISVEDRPASP